MKSKRYAYSRKLVGVGIVMSGLCLGLSAFGQSRDTDPPTAAGGPPFYDLTWHTIDGGGVMFSTGGDLELSGTIGQHDAGGQMTGGDFELTGGFWFEIAPGDCNVDGGVTLFDYDVFEACMTGPVAGPLSPECACFDLDRSGTVDMLDFGELQEGFSGS